MIKILNIVEGKEIFTTDSLDEFVFFTNTLRLENEDFDIRTDCLTECVYYIQTYCSNLHII